jgi:hypothetical protein
LGEEGLGILEVSFASSLESCKLILQLGIDAAQTGEPAKRMELKDEASYKAIWRVVSSTRLASAACEVTNNILSVCTVQLAAQAAIFLSLLLQSSVGDG